MVRMLHATNMWPGSSFGSSQPSDGLVPLAHLRDRIQSAHFVAYVKDGFSNSSWGGGGLDKGFRLGL